jgi:hypothetical protein
MPLIGGQPWIGCFASNHEIFNSAVSRLLENYEFRRHEIDSDDVHRSEVVLKPLPKRNTPKNSSRSIVVRRTIDLGVNYLSITAELKANYPFCVSHKAIEIDSYIKKALLIVCLLQFHPVDWHVPSPCDSAAMHETH